MAITATIDDGWARYGLEQYTRRIHTTTQMSGPEILRECIRRVHQELPDKSLPGADVALRVMEDMKSNLEATPGPPTVTPNVVGMTMEQIVHQILDYHFRGVRSTDAGIHAAAQAAMQSLGQLGYEVTLLRNPMDLATEFRVRSATGMTVAWQVPLAYTTLSQVGNSTRMYWDSETTRGY